MCDKAKDNHSVMRPIFFLLTTQPATPQITSWVSLLNSLRAGGSSDARRLPILRAAINHWIVISSKKKRQVRSPASPSHDAGKLPTSPISSLNLFDTKNISSHRLIAKRAGGQNDMTLFGGPRDQGASAVAAPQPVTIWPIHLPIRRFNII